MNIDEPMAKPIRRSKLRSATGLLYYSMVRKMIWIKMNRFFAQDRTPPLPYTQCTRQTPLLRELKNVDMQYKYNKIVNLKIAAKCINDIVLHPGQMFSYWKLIRRPSQRKGYIKDMVLHNGTLKYGTGGGLCQMSNLIYWLTLHTPLTIVERHRHGYDVFPDSNRTQPFGSGATCFYPHGDLMIRNDTNLDFQILIHAGENFLSGEWRSTQEPSHIYTIVEKKYRMQSNYWGAYSRHNELYRQVYDLHGALEKKNLLQKIMRS